MSKHGVGHRHKRHSGIHTWAMSIVVLLFLAIAGLAVAGVMFYRQAQTVKSCELEALSVLQTDGSIVSRVSDVSDKLPAMQSKAMEAETIAHGPLWNIATKLPFIGEDVATVQGMTSIVSDIMQETATQFVSIANTLQDADLRTSDGGLNLQPIIEVTPTVNQLNTTIKRQIQHYNALTDPHFSAIAGPYQQGREMLGKLSSQIEAYTDTFAVLPALLGGSQVQTYAVMAMTTSEMRSSGGLIGSVGELTTHNGDIEVGEFRPNSEYLPYSVGDHSEDEKRIFSDEGPLNMSFDIRDTAVFTDTARAAVAMRSIWDRAPWGQKTSIDGIIMIDPVFVQELIAINGDVTLSDGTVLNGKNAAEFLLNGIYKKYPIEQTDMVFAEVASQAISSMFANPSVERLAQIADVLGKMAKERHLSIYSFNEQQEQTFQHAGFTAQPPRDETNPAVGIYLTEQNPSKMGWYLKRSAKIKQLGCEKEHGCTYHVEYTLTNTITEQEAQNLTWYITGNNPNNTGKAMEKILFYPPAGGAISNLILLNGEANAVREDILNGETIYRTYIQLLPGQQAIYSFDVTTSPHAISELTIDQTPLQRAGSGFEYVSQ